MKLKNKVAIVTGSGRGLGREIALAYAEEGADLVLVSRTSSEVEAVGHEIRALDREVLVSPTNVAVPEEVSRMVQRAQEKFGKIDILVNNAGIAYLTSLKPLIEMDLKEWRAVLDTNLTGTFLCCKAVLGNMIEQKSGVILNLSSDMARTAYAKTSAYTATKAGIEGLTRILATELAPFNIRVNSIRPNGPMATRLVFSILKDITRPIPHLFRPDAIRPLAVYLASEAAAGVTGQCLSATDWILEHGPGKLSDYWYSEKT